MFTFRKKVMKINKSSVLRQSYNAYLSFQYCDATKGYQLLLTNHTPLPFVDSNLFYPSWVEFWFDTSNLNNFGLFPDNSNSVIINPLSFEIQNLDSVCIKGPNSTDFNHHANSLPGERINLVSGHITSSDVTKILYTTPPYLHPYLLQLFEVVRYGRFQDVSLNPSNIPNFWLYCDQLLRIYPHSTHPIENQMLTDLYKLSRIG